MNLTSTSTCPILILLIFAGSMIACSQDTQETQTQNKATVETDKTQEAPAQNITIIAHRGDSWNAPENTLAAVNMA